MPSRTILSPAQRTAIFDPSADSATVERLYTLGPDDLGQVARRRRGANRLGYLRSSGIEVPDELLAHVAPLGWEHIGLTGDYLWSDVDKPREQFRPLRLHQTSRDA